MSLRPPIRGHDPRVSAILIYPVKSCGEVMQGTALALAEGFQGDRSFQVTDGDGKFCTPRTKGMEKLFHVRCLLSKLQLRLSLSSDPALPDCVVDVQAQPTEVVATVLAVPAPVEEVLLDYGDAAAKWLEKATGIRGCRLHGISSRYGRTVVMNPKVGEAVPEEDAPMSLADEAPYMLASSASLEDLNRQLFAEGSKAVDMRRFRPNVVIEGLEPWEEETWKRIKIGEVEFWNWQRCGRCQMTTIDRDTLARGKEPLKMLGQHRKVGGSINFGVHLIPTRSLPAEGFEIRIGDELKVLEYHEERVQEHQKKYPMFVA